MSRRSIGRSVMPAEVATLLAVLASVAAAYAFIIGYYLTWLLGNASIAYGTASLWMTILYAMTIYFLWPLKTRGLYFRLLYQLHKRWMIALRQQ